MHSDGENDKNNKRVALNYLFIKTVLLGTCTGISFVDSTPLRVCRNQRIHIHKTFEGLATRGKWGGSSDSNCI